MFKIFLILLIDIFIFLFLIVNIIMLFCFVLGVIFNNKFILISDLMFLCKLINFLI